MTNNKTISIDVVIEWLKNKDIIKLSSQEEIARKELKELSIKELPSVTPQPKMARWIDDKCSECGKGIEDLIDSREWYRNEQPNFCPFCGLKLIDSQESEEEK